MKKLLLLCIIALTHTLYTNADTKVLYEGGTTTKPWTTEMVSQWVADQTLLIDNSYGLYYTTKSNSSDVQKVSINPTANAIINIDAYWYGMSNTGRSFSTGHGIYFSFADVFVVQNDQDKKHAYGTNGIDNIASATTFTGSSLYRNYDISKHTFLHIEMEINTLSNTLNYLRISKEGATNYLVNITDITLSSPDYSSIVLGFKKGGSLSTQRSNYLKSIIVTETTQSVQTSEYTIDYVNQAGNSIKESKTMQGAVGDKINLSDLEKESFYNNGKKYIYVSDDSQNQEISSDGSTKVTITFREAATYNYSFVSDKGDVITAGSDYEGEVLTIGYPRYYLNKSDSTLVEAGVNNKEYRKSITLDANNKQETIAYNNDGTKNSIAFYTEGEDIAGAVTTTSWGSVAVRASNALTATTTEDLYITSLPAGKYKIHVGCFTDGKGHTIKLALGDRILNFFVPVSSDQLYTVNLYEVASQEIAISKTTQLLLLADGLNTFNSLDYLYVEKTGHMEESKYGDWMESEGGEYDPENGLAPSEKFPTGSIESPTRPENGLITFPEEDTENSDAVGTVTGIDSASAAVKVVAIYTANGKRVNALQKGINIVTLSDGKRVKIIK